MIIKDERKNGWTTFGKLSAGEAFQIEDNTTTTFIKSFDNLAICLNDGVSEPFEDDDSVLFVVLEIIIKA